MAKYVILILLTIIGAVLFSISTWFLKGNLWSVFQNVGFGLFTSFLVTLLIEIMNDVREKKNKKKQKEMVFINVKKLLWNCYSDLLFRLNRLRMSLTKENCIFLLSADNKNQIQHLIEVFQAEGKFDIRNIYNQFLDDFHVDVYDELIFSLKNIDSNVLFLNQIITNKEKNTLEIPTIENVEKISTCAVESL